MGNGLECEDYVRLDKPVIAVGTARIDVKVSSLHDGILGEAKAYLVMIGVERASVEVLRGVSVSSIMNEGTTREIVYVGRLGLCLSLQLYTFILAHAWCFLEI